MDRFNSYGRLWGDVMVSLKKIKKKAEAERRRRGRGRSRKPKPITWDEDCIFHVTRTIIGTDNKQYKVEHVCTNRFCRRSGSFCSKKMCSITTEVLRGDLSILVGYLNVSMDKLIKAKRLVDSTFVLDVIDGIDEFDRELALTLLSINERLSPLFKGVIDDVSVINHIVFKYKYGVCPKAGIYGNEFFECDKTVCKGCNHFATELHDGGKSYTCLYFEGLHEKAKKSL